MRDTQKKNPYEILQIAENAEEEVIEGAYPSVGSEIPSDHSNLPGATLRMQEINWAYGVLRDARKRKELDLSNVVIPLRRICPKTGHSSGSNRR